MSKSRNKFILTPKNRYIVVKEISMELKLKSGLILPSQSKTNSNGFRVMAVSEKCECGAAVGDMILINPMSGFPFTSEGVQYRIVADMDVIGIYDVSKLKATESDAPDKTEEEQFDEAVEFEGEIPFIETNPDRIN